MSIAATSAASATNANSAAIDVTGVSKAFGDNRVLRGVALHAEPGTIVALLGPSGCGKTTLLRVIAGLEPPDQGEVRLGDRLLTAPGTNVPPERRRVGMVFQDWALFPHLTVAGNVGYGLPRHERSERVAEALAMVGLGGVGDRTPSTLSGGQQQRVALARALAPRPVAILLDEPFSNLDTTLRVQVRADVRRLLEDLGITAVFVTHDQEEAFVLGHEVAVMHGGVIEQQASPAELYHAPATPFVATFVGDANLVEGRASAGVAETPIGRVPLVPTVDRGHVWVLLRPEMLGVDDGDDGEITGVEFYGHDAMYDVRLDTGLALKVRVAAAPRYRRGDRVDVHYAGGQTVAYGDGSVAAVPATAMG